MGDAGQRPETDGKNREDKEPITVKSRIKI
jgi:hypothetical protein